MRKNIPVKERREVLFRFLIARNCYNKQAIRKFHQKCVADFHNVDNHNLHAPNHLEITYKASKQKVQQSLSKKIEISNPTKKVFNIGNKIEDVCEKIQNKSDNLINLNTEQVCCGQLSCLQLTEATLNCQHKSSCLRNNLSHNLNRVKQKGSIKSLNSGGQGKGKQKNIENVQFPTIRKVNLPKYLNVRKKCHYYQSESALNSGAISLSKTGIEDCLSTLDDTTDFTVQDQSKLRYKGQKIHKKFLLKQLQEKQRCGKKCKQILSIPSVTPSLNSIIHFKNALCCKQSKLEKVCEGRLPNVCQQALHSNKTDDEYCGSSQNREIRRQQQGDADRQLYRNHKEFSFDIKDTRVLKNVRNRNNKHRTLIEKDKFSGCDDDNERSQICSLPSAILRAQSMAQASNLDSQRAQSLLTHAMKAKEIKVWVGKRVVKQPKRPYKCLKIQQIYHKHLNRLPA